MVCLSSPTLAGNPSASFLRLEGEGERLFCIVWQGRFVSWEGKCLPTDYKKRLSRQDIQHTPCKLHFDVIK